MAYSESEKTWLKRRARKIAAETGDPLPAAVSAAIAELHSLRHGPKAALIPFPPPKAPALPRLPRPPRGPRHQHR